MTHQPGVYVPLRALFLVINFVVKQCDEHYTCNIIYVQFMNCTLRMVMHFVTE